MKPRKDNWVCSRRVKPKHGETVWVTFNSTSGPQAMPAIYHITEDEDVPEGFFWELPLVQYVYGHRHWQPRFPNQPKPEPALAPHLYGQLNS